MQFKYYLSIKLLAVLLTQVTNELPWTHPVLCKIIIVLNFSGKFAVKENAKDPVQFRTAKNVGLIAGGTGMGVLRHFCCRLKAVSSHFPSWFLRLICMISTFLLNV